MKWKGWGGDGRRKEVVMDLKGHLRAEAYRAQMVSIQVSDYH